MQQSYNIEMTELTGGTFWAPYTDAQILGEEPFTIDSDRGDMVKTLMALHVKVDPIDLSEPRIRAAAAALGPAIIRFSGSWATRTYYDFDGRTGGIVPDGFDFILTAGQWQGALDFARSVGAKILVSVANSSGVHENGTGPWQPDQAELLWNYTAAQGMTIDYAEFMNEPNMLPGMKLPDGYGLKELSRDHDLFARWLKEDHPETTYVGPCSADGDRKSIQGGSMMPLLKTRDILNGCQIMPEIFSYHSYNGISERGAMFGCHYGFDQALDEDYLSLTMDYLDFHMSIRDEFVPGAPMWITESADAACGGNTWAPTFAEAIRYIDEQCRFALKTDGVIFHNTLASSAYGLLDQQSHLPRPQYWAGLLFNRLCGERVYDTHEPLRKGLHLFAFSRADQTDGICYVCINNSLTGPTVIDTPSGMLYMLTAPAPRSRQICLNGRPLSMTPDDTIPGLQGSPVPKGSLSLPPCSITFLTV